MKEIPFPKVTLVPCHLGNRDIIFSLNGDIFPSEIKKVFFNHMDHYYSSFRPKYPTRPREFYIIPFKGMRNNLEIFNLRVPEFAALWIPDIADKTNEIRAKLSGEAKEIAIVGYDYHFSSFYGGRVLAVDISLGSPTYVLWEKDEQRFSLDPTYCLLAESIN